MRTRLKWSAMTAKEKVERILKDVLHWSCFATVDSAHQCAEKTCAFDAPVAFWNDQIAAWCVFFHAGDEHARTFDPLTRMDDAMLILQVFHDWRMEPLPYHNGQLDYLVTIRIPITEGRIRLCDGIAASLPLAICFAALEARGVAIDRSASSHLHTSHDEGTEGGQAGI